MALYYHPGDYVAVVEDQAWQETRNNDPMLVLRFRPVAELTFDESGKEQEFPVEAPYDRRVYIAFPSHSDQACDLSIQKLRFGCGWQGTDFNELDLVGQRIRVRCSEGTYKGKPSEDWQVPLPGFETEPLEDKAPDAPRRLNALFGRRLKEDRRGSEEGSSDDLPPPPSSVNDGAPEYEDDDIPF